MYISTMWPSFLSRSLPPPLLSHLRRPTSAGCGSLLLSGSSSQILSRVYTKASANNFYPNPANGPQVSPGTWPHFFIGCGANQLLPRRHLYVVLDDWKEGFSLHKICLDDLLPGGGGDGDELQRLPNPILRLRFGTVGRRPRLHGLGSNIVITSDSSSFHEDKSLTLVYNTETAALDVEHSLPRDLTGLYHAVAASDKLYTLDSHNTHNSGLPFLCQIKPDYTPLGNFDCDEEEDLPYCLRPHRRWTWEKRPVLPPFPRGQESYLSAYALHPDGRTLFASFKSSGYSKDMGTFTLDTERGGEWTCRGDWCLPFSGHTHYDCDLGAWVGTRTVNSKEDGCGYKYLCTCDVPDIGEGAPDWTVAKEKLTFLEAPLKTLGRVLLPIGGGSVFCIVEPAVRQGFSYKSFLGDGNKCLLRVTMFRAKYDRKGELVAAPLQPGRSYLISRYVGNFGPYAFWI